jgi:hypothetical protein
LLARQNRNAVKSEIMFESPASTRHRPVFRADPWVGDYTSAFQIDEAQEEHDTQLPVDLTVEQAEWSAVSPPVAIDQPEAVVFVDGVQNVDQRLLAVGEDGAHINAALVSIAAGAFIVRPETPRIEEVRAERCLVVGNPSECDALEIPWGDISVLYRHHPYPQGGYQAVAQAIDGLRRNLELEVAEAMTRRGYPLVVMDGRLRIFPGDLTSVVGYAKTMHTRYLPPIQWALLPQLAAGQRTPVFRIEQQKPLYSWYLRLQEPRPADFAFSGIVRLEAIAEMPDTRAVFLADLTAAILPSLASHPWQDPRAPQNLLPLSALEDSLRRELGDRNSLRRAITDYLHVQETI